MTTAALTAALTAAPNRNYEIKLKNSPTLKKISNISRISFYLAQ
jgi:hypothetical protein